MISGARARLPAPRAPLGARPRRVRRSSGSSRRARTGSPTFPRCRGAPSAGEPGGGGGAARGAGDGNAALRRAPAPRRAARLQVVVERASQRAQVVLVGNAADPAPLAPLASALEDLLASELHSLWWNGNPARTNVILGPHWHRFSGPETRPRAHRRSRRLLPAGRLRAEPSRAGGSAGPAGARLGSGAATRARALRRLRADRARAAGAKPRGRLQRSVAGGPGGPRARPRRAPRGRARAGARDPGRSRRRRRARSPRATS